jgi:hypothetical protein
MGLSEEQAAREREAFLVRLEDVARTTLQASENMTRINDGYARIFGQGVKVQAEFLKELKKLNDHITAFENFMDAMLSTYNEDDGEIVREDLVTVMKSLGQIFSALRRGKSS